MRVFVLTCIWFPTFFISLSWVYPKFEHWRMQMQDTLVSSCLNIYFLSVYIPFYIAWSKSSMPSINMSTIANPPATASTSTWPSLISGKKQKKGLPSHHKPSKVPKPDHDVDGKNEGIGDEETNDFNFEAIIPEGFNPQTKSSHTECRRQSANAWQEVMPSLIYPLMATLHSIAPNSTNSAIDVAAFTCKSGCDIKWSMVKSVSFGGM